MNRISKKGRIWIAIGCFFCSVSCLASLIVLLDPLNLAAVVFLGIHVVAFIIAGIIFIPPKGYEPIQTENKGKHRTRRYKSKEYREPFISDEEWEELEEEDEEAEMFDEIFGDDK